MHIAQSPASRMGRPRPHLRSLGWRPPKSPSVWSTPAVLHELLSNQLDEAVRLVSPSVVYTVPGSSPIAGVFHGPDEVRRHMGKLIEVSGGTFEVLKWIDWMIGEMHITALQYAQAQNRGGIYRGHHIYLLESDPDD